MTQQPETATIIPFDEFVRISQLTFRWLGIYMSKQEVTMSALFYVPIFGLVMCIICVFNYNTVQRTYDFRINTHVAVVHMILTIFVWSKMRFITNQFVALEAKFEKCFPSIAGEQKEYETCATIFMMKFFTGTQLGTCFNCFSTDDILELWFRVHRSEVDFIHSLWHPFGNTPNIFEIGYIHPVITSALNIIIILTHESLVRMHSNHGKGTFTTLNTSDADKLAEKLLAGKFLFKHCLLYA